MSDLWNNIDLHKHGVIEAHAGTGKTYTIVKLVLRMLTETALDAKGRSHLIHIRELLLVTFTEKAAGELKKRIREGLEDRIATLPDGNHVRIHLEDCLNNLHEALIGTIHAVCLRLLQTWPFESGVPFTTEIVDDGEVLETALRESMRTDWQEEATCIPWALRTMADAGTRIKKQHFTLLKGTAKELLDDTFVRLDRTATQGMDLCALYREHSRITALLSEQRGSITMLLEELIGALTTAKESGGMAPDRMDLLEQRLPKLQKMVAEKTEDPGILLRPCRVGTKGIYTAADLKKIPGIAAADAAARAMADHPFTKAMQQKNNLETLLLLTLIGDGAILLAQRWQRIKKRNGFISYQDMLRLMYGAVTERGQFTAALRKKLRYAIIDEFQDTSRLQWEIFNHLFLQNDTPESPRLYIVGDPKQSIYAFMGADVHSYLDAKQAIVSRGAAPYRLTGNFRSVDAVIQGYNTVFTLETEGTPWFRFDAGEQGSIYSKDNAVTSPDREAAPEHEVPVPPLQIIALEGNAASRRNAMALHTCEAIERLIGTTVSVPDGPGWKNCTLAYEHFAVIVESNNSAEPFLEMFREHHIPAVKYKMGGVFQSPMARGLHTLLRAILRSSGDPAPRLAALLTLFFNRKPESIDTEHDLEPCPDTGCRGDDLCIMHALQEWTGLAAGSYWSQLFERIQRRTGIYERLIRLSDGERQIADLRQVIDYCIELLYCENYTLTHLVEHLGGLIEEEIQVGQERNLHVLETQKSSVKVLTMHAAKGLEFPVVFVVTGASKEPWDGPNFIRFTDNDTPDGNGGRTVKITPYLSKNDIRCKRGGQTLEAYYIEQATQERRRLLYVALTRAQALLFVPLHLKHLPQTDSGAINWASCEHGSGKDGDLTPVLLHLLDALPDKNVIALFNPDKFPASRKRPVNGTTGVVTAPPVEEIPDIGSLRLLTRVCRQTSYSQLSREATVSREVDRSEEVDEEAAAAVPLPSLLPGGKRTGDALHCAIEEILRADDSTAIITDKARMRTVVSRYLTRNGITAQALRSTGAGIFAAEDAITAACTCVTGALTAAITLPEGTELDSVGSLEKPDRLPEMEFLCNLEQHWVHGFMDLVFRVAHPRFTAHPWRYYVLDWKSDILAAYTPTAVGECIRQRHYDLQAHLYVHALDRYLQGVLGDAYRPALHLGGAVYLFLREHEREVQQKATVWTHRADPVADAAYVADKVNARQV